MQMNQINLDINKAGQIINEPVVLRVGEEDQTITVSLLKDGQPYTSFTTATFFANKPSGAIVANDPANISSGTITYTVPQALVNEFGKITNAYFLIDGKVSTESFVIAILQGVNISDDLNDYIPGMGNLNVIYDKWKAKLQTITDELNGVDAPKEVKNVIDNELKNYTDQINELQRRITSTENQLNALVVPVNAVGTNLLTNSNFSSGLDNWAVYGQDCKAVVTTDSDGDTCAHITGTGNSCGLWRTPVSFDQNQVTTGSVLVKGTGTLYLAGLDNRPASNFGTISTQSYSKVGSTMQASSKPANFAIYFNPVNGVVDVYIKLIKLEKGSIATDHSLNPEEISTNDDVQTAISNALSDVKTQITDSLAGTNLLLKTDVPFNMTGNGTSNQAQRMYSLSKRIEAGTIVAMSFDAVSTAPAKFMIQNDGSDSGNWMIYITDNVNTTKKHYVATVTLSDSSDLGVNLRFDNVPSTTTVTISNMKMQLAFNAESVKTEIANAIKVDVGKTITATDDTGKTVKLKITGIS